MAKQPQNTAPIINIHNTTHPNNPPPPLPEPNKGGNKNTAIVVAVITMLTAVAVPITVHLLKQCEQTPSNTECTILKAKLKTEEKELLQIVNLLKLNSTSLQLNADKLTHEDNIQSIKSEITTKKCD